MTGLLHVADPLARNVAAIVVNAMWEGAAVFFVVALLLRFWPRMNAATRYAVWCVALAASVAVPVFTTHFAVRAMPTTQSVATLVPHRLALTGAGVRDATAARIGAAGRSHDATGAAPAQTAAFVAPRMTVPSVVVLIAVAIWALAALILLARLAGALVRLERLKANALPLPMRYRDAIAFGNEDLHARPVRLCVSDETDVPIAVGLFDAMILIPTRLLQSLSCEEIEQIYLHELAHLRRADDWTNLLQRVATALAWCSPAIYGIARALDVEREAACDDDVVARTGAVRPYARCLTHMAEITAWPHRPLAAPGAFVTRRGISERIERLLSAGRTAARGFAVAPAAVALTLLGALALAMPNLAITLAAPVSTPPPTLVQHASVRHVDVRARHVHVEERRIDVPPVHVHVPAQDIHVPATHVHVPAVNVNVPAVDVHVPSMNYDMPGMHFTVPAVNVDVPAMHFDVPDTSEVWSEHRSASCSSGCDFTDVAWTGRNLSGRRFAGVDFSDAQLENANFSNAHLSAIDFARADLRHANFDGATLTHVEFAHARLDGATFDGASIAVCDFSGVDLSHVDLSRARLDTICKASLSGR